MSEKNVSFCNCDCFYSLEHWLTKPFLSPADLRDGSDYCIMHWQIQKTIQNGKRKRAKHIVFNTFLWRLNKSFCFVVVKSKTKSGLKEVKTETSRRTRCFSSQKMLNCCQGFSIKVWPIYFVRPCWPNLNSQFLTKLLWFESLNIVFFSLTITALIGVIILDVHYW